MSDTVINLGGVPVYMLGLLVTFCFLWGGFVFYKKSIEAHFDDEAILDMIVLGAFWGFLLSRLGFVLSHLTLFWGHWTRVFLLTNYPGLDRWGFLVGLFLGLYWLTRKMKYKFLDLLDLACLGVLSGMSLFWVGLSLVLFRWQHILIGSLLFFGFLLFWNLEKSYRLIGWYRAQRTSARSGFVSGFGLTFLGLLFGLEQVIYRSVSVRSVIWVTVMVVSGLLLVYIRSGRVLNEDINSLKIWKKKIKK